MRMLLLFIRLTNILGNNLWTGKMHYNSIIRKSILAIFTVFLCLSVCNISYCDKHTLASKTGFQSDEFKDVMGAALEVAHARKAKRSFSSEVRIEQLTKEAAEANVARLVELRNMIPGEVWDEQRFLSDVSRDGKVDLVRHGKWKHSLYATDKNGKIIGVLLAYERPHTEMAGVGRGSLYVLAVAVDPDYRGSGVGAILFNKLSENFLLDGYYYFKNERGPPIVTLITGQLEVRNNEIYQSLGFEVVGTQNFLKKTYNVYQVNADVLLERSSTIIDVRKMMGNIVPEELLAETKKTEIKVALVAPRSLSGFVDLLEAGFKEAHGAGNVKINITIEMPEEGENMSDFASRVRDEGYDAHFIQFHGAEREDEVAFEFYGANTVLLMHRPEEILERYKNGYYDPAEGKDFEWLLRRTNTVMLFGRAKREEYRLLANNVDIVTYGFHNVDPAYAEGRDLNIAAIGAVTTWGPMRFVSDAINVIRQVKKMAAEKQVFGYLSGDFLEDRVEIKREGEPLSSESVYELDRYEKSEDILMLKAEDIEKDFTDTGDLAAYKKWLYEKSGGGRKIIIVTGKFKNDAMSKLEKRLIDFETQLFREVYNVNWKDKVAAKVEYSQTLHERPGRSIPIVFKSPSMDDLRDLDRINLVEVNIINGEIDAESAARQILTYLNNPKEYNGQRDYTMRAAKITTMREAALSYERVLKNPPIWYLKGHIWNSVKLAGTRKIEILIPLRVRKQLDNDILTRIKSMGISVRWLDETNLMQTLKQKRTGYDRILISDEVFSKIISKKRSEPDAVNLFNDIRVITFYEIFKDPELQQTMFVTSVLSRLLTQDVTSTNMSVRSALKIILSDVFDNDEQWVETFLENMAAADGADHVKINERLDYFLSSNNAIRLIKELNRAVWLSREFLRYA